MADQPRSGRDLDPENSGGDVLTRDGYVILKQSESWSVVSDVGRRHFHFGDMGISEELKIRLKAYVDTKLRGAVFRTAVSHYEWLRALLSHVGTYDPCAIEITGVHLLNFRSSLDHQRLSQSTNANDAVRYWARLGLRGVSGDAVTTAKDMPREGREGITSLRLRCPIRGAYSDLEYDGLYKALHDSFARGNISLTNYALCIASGAICPRPSQLAALQLRDIKSTNGANGEEYFISVPRAKQNGSKYRGQFTDRPLVDEVAFILRAQARSVHERALQAGLEMPQNAPLFPAEHASSTFFAGPSVPARPTPASIAMRIANVMEGLGVMSERTGQIINVNSTRARRTIGTRAARNGSSLSEIAVLLDHSTTTTAKVYVEMSSELLQNLDKKVAMLMAPMAQRFLGNITERGLDGDTVVQRHVLGTSTEGEGPQDIGGCGKHGYCGLGRPIACYTCRLFHPWADGPHEAILDGLLDRRQRMASLGSQMVAAALDDTIIACAEVVRLCLLRQDGCKEAPNV